MSNLYVNRIRDAVEDRERARTALQAIFDAAENRELTPDERRTEGELRARMKTADANEAQALSDLENEARADEFLDRLGAYSSSDAGSTTEGAWLANEVRALTGASGVGAAWTPEDQSSRVLDFLAARSVFLASGVQIIRTDRDQIAFPHLTSDASSSWVDPGETISSTDPGGETLTAVPQKVAALVAMHNEIIRDASPAIVDTVAKSLMRSLALRYDLGAFEGSGTAPEPRGLKNIVGIQTFSMGQDGASLTDLDPFAEALGLLDTENANSDTAVFVVHPRTWKAASKLKETSGSNKALLQESAGSGSQGIERSIYGRPVFLSSQLAIDETEGTSSEASSIYCYDVEQVYAVLRQDVEVAMDRSRLFDQDSSEIRATLRATLAVPNPKSVVRVTGVLA